MIASPYSTFSTLRDHGSPIGTPYEVTNPAGLAYWAPDEWFEESTSTRRAMACHWTPPTPSAPPMSDAEFFTAMFGEPGQ